MPIERRLLETGSHRVPVDLARLQGPPLTDNRPAPTVTDCVPHLDPMLLTGKVSGDGVYECGARHGE